MIAIMLTVIVRRHGNREGRDDTVRGHDTVRGADTWTLGE